MVGEPPAHICFVESMDREVVERVEAGLPPADMVVGLGGGMALDMAKYVAWRRGVDPVLVPSIASVDACVTNTIAVREEGKVRYIGFSVPQVVLADFGLMASAPPTFEPGRHRRHPLDTHGAVGLADGGRPGTDSV